jgi:hypothetical protein
MCMNVYVYVYVRFVLSVFIIIHSQLVTKNVA